MNVFVGQRRAGQGIGDSGKKRLQLSEKIMGRCLF